jgi:hypothetical protein
MRNLINCILLFAFLPLSYCQNEKIQQQVSAIFFGFNINEKPSKIEYENRIPFDPDGKAIIEQNTVQFTSNPFFKGEIVGNYNITYLYDKIYGSDLFDKYGIYHMQMQITFKNYNECKNSFYELKDLFKDDTIRSYTKLGTENEPKSQKTTYLIDSDLQLPRIEIQYLRGPHRLIIDVYTTWSFKKFRNNKEKLF